MKILLDTHVWIWTQSYPEELGPKSLGLVMDTENELFVSTISTLEIARLVTSGRIELPMGLSLWVKRSLKNLSCGTLTIGHEIAVNAYGLKEPFHKDPADRIIAATAKVHNLVLLTADTLMLEYPHITSFNAKS